MPKRRKRLLPVPMFRTAEEEAAFWETHDTTDYALEEVTEPLTLSPTLRAQIVARWKQRKACTFHLTPTQAQKVHQVAQQKGVDAQRLVRQWVQQALRKELSK